MTRKKYKKQFGVAPGCVPTPKVFHYGNERRPIRISNKCSSCDGSGVIGQSFPGFYDSTRPCFECLRRVGQGT